MGNGMMNTGCCAEMKNSMEQFYDVLTFVEQQVEMTKSIAPMMGATNRQNQEFTRRDRETTSQWKNREK